MDKEKQDRLNMMLYEAIDLEDMDIIKALVKAGANVNAELKFTEEYRSEWHEKVWTEVLRLVDGTMKCYQILKFLLDNGAKVDYEDIYISPDIAQPATTKEFYNEEIETLNTLLRAYKKQGGDININENTFLDLAVGCALPEVVYCLVNELGATVKGTNVLNDVSNLYFYTDSNEACKVIKFLIDKGVDVDSYIYNSCSTGSLVVFNQSSKLREERANKILQLLVDNGANVNLLIEHPDMHYTLSLISASVYANNFKSAHILLDNDADVNLIDDTLKRNALMCFADSEQDTRYSKNYINKKERDYVLKEIVRKTKDLDAKDTDGKTALQIAMKNGKEDVVSEIEKEKERRNKFADRG